MMLLQDFLQEQPARKLYPFDRGWRVLDYGLKQLFQHDWSIIQFWSGIVQDLIAVSLSERWLKRFWLYVWALVLSLYGVVFVVAAVLIEIIAVAVFSIYLVVHAFLYTILIIFFTIITLITAKVQAKFYCCPSCHRSMPVPVYRCKCGKEHSRLAPNLYGILKHTCNGCGENLPTLMILGRDNSSMLRRHCPHCKRPLNKGIGKGSNIHIPLVGGPSVGKTTYMVTSIYAFKRFISARYATTPSFPDSSHERDFENSMAELNVGRTLLKTADRVPYAYNLLFQVRRSWCYPKLLYLYDAAGEIFGSLEGLSHQEYYTYTKGILFIIDPFAIPNYYKQHSEEIKQISTLLRPATLDIDDTYGRLIETLDAVKTSRHRHSMPIAIVVNKIDALNLEDEIGESAAQALKLQDPSLSTEDAISSVVKEFLLQYGLGNLVHNLDSRFHHVRYFSCSTLGRLPLPTDNSSFTSIRVLEPLLWILTTSKVITKK